MVEPLENLYFNWLCAKIYSNGNQAPSNTYWRLLRTLHNTEFVWLLVGDDNRFEDGLALRAEYIIQLDLPDLQEWRRNPPCSVLEMLIAFSRRAEFNAGDGSAKDWFWEMLRNLGLDEFNDGVVGTDTVEIEDILDNMIWRTYKYSGKGGLFPLDRPERDQREVEIWYQFCDYLVDQNRLP